MAEIINFEPPKEEPKGLKSLPKTIPFKKSVSDVIDLKERAGQMEDDKKRRKEKERKENLENGILEIGKSYIFKRPMEMRGKPLKKDSKGYEVVFLKEGKMLEEMQLLKEPVRYKIIGIPEGEKEEFVCFIKKDELKGNIERELSDA